MLSFETFRTSLDWPLIASFSQWTGSAIRNRRPRGRGPILILCAKPLPPKLRHSVTKSWTSIHSFSNAIAVPRNGSSTQTMATGIQSNTRSCFVRSNHLISCDGCDSRCILDVSELPRSRTFAAWLDVSRLNERDAILIFSVGGGDAGADQPEPRQGDRFCEDAAAKVLGLSVRAPDMRQKSAM